MPRAPVICITHGGGPMPVIGPEMGDKGHKDINYSLQNRVPKILKLGTPDAPRAVVVITPHWLPDHPTISSAAHHDVYYDYEDVFPPAAFQLKYDAPGSPEVAEEVYKAFHDAGLSPVKDTERGWDHGIFIPFILISPKGEVPIVQVSIVKSEDPATHIKMGIALESLRDNGVAIVGSGFASLHNPPAMRALYFGGPEEVQHWGPLVDGWNAALTKVVLAGTTEERARGLEKWQDLPHAAEIHPEGETEHLMPLIVCAGAAGNSKGGSYTDVFCGVDVYTYYWGADDVVVE